MLNKIEKMIVPLLAGSTKNLVIFDAIRTCGVEGFADACKMDICEIIHTFDDKIVTEPLNIRGGFI